MATLESEADVRPRRAATVVMKFGGTSVADAEKIKAVAARLVAAHREGSRVVGVISAMGHMTDELIMLARDVSPSPNPRELDMLLSVGERISCALAAMAIHDLGCAAVSLAGSQAGIVTDSTHTKAKVVEIRPHRIQEALGQGKVVLVAGFQGVSTAHDITTLGRGGSDTTAVALAAAVGADSCEIYTDVEGVFTADPRIVPEARKLDALSFDEMLELAASDARVIQLRAVEYARNHDVTLHVRSTFSSSDGTWIRKEDERMLEQARISGVAHAADEVLYRVSDVELTPLFAALAEANVNVDTIVRTDASEVVFSAPEDDRADVTRALDGIGARWQAREDLGKVSLVGAGMESHPGVAARMFSTLSESGITMEVVNTSPIKIACYVPSERVTDAVRALHAAFQLAAPAGVSANG